jgi:hypothetical protein
LKRLQERLTSRGSPHADDATADRLPDCALRASSSCRRSTQRGGGQRCVGLPIGLRQGCGGAPKRSARRRAARRRGRRVESADPGGGAAEAARRLGATRRWWG